MADVAGPAAAGMTTALRPLLKAIAERPHEFDFFQALRRVDAANPDNPRLGQSARPSEDAVRLGQPPSLVFAPRPVAGVAGLGDDDAADTGRPARIEAYLFGLFGPNGPLPLHLTEYAHSRMLNVGDETFARFADMFHHRMASLFFRAWAESEPTVSHDRPEEDRFGTQLAALAGLGMASLRNRDRMPDLSKQHFTGRLASHTRNPEGLQAILGSFFEAPVEIQEFVPHWVQLPPESLCLLGRDPNTGTLGSTLTAGARIKVYHHRFRIVIGPLRLASYERLLPGGEGLAKLVPIVRNYVGDELEFELNLILRHDEVPAVRLGKSGKLGWTGWLGKRRRGVDARDLIKTASTEPDTTSRSPPAGGAAEGSLP
jgi:type VI secretion system protein ImpH